MRAVIISGGSIHNHKLMKRYIQGDDYIICADSGYDHACKMQIVPDLLVGDMDSIESKIEIEEVRTFPAKKNYTDTEIAAKAAVELGFKEIAFFGVTGTRMDHTVTNILLIKSLYENGITSKIIDEHNEIMITRKSITVNGKIGDLVSIIPITNCKGVSTCNLEYQLHNALLEVGTSRGVSNIMLADSARIDIESGFALIMKCID